MLFNWNQEKVSSLYDDASKAILAQATGGDGASSKEIEEASTAVFGGAVNIIKSADVKQKDEVMISWPEKGHFVHGVSKVIREGVVFFLLRLTIDPNLSLSPKVLLKFKNRHDSISIIPWLFG